jgi:hypothetical protein
MLPLKGCGRLMSGPIADLYENVDFIKVLDEPDSEHSAN